MRQLYFPGKTKTLLQSAMSLIRRTVHVSNVKSGVKTGEIEKFFSACGQVSCVFSPGEGLFYIIFVEQEAVERAITSLQSQVFAGRQLKISPVTPEFEGALKSLMKQVVTSAAGAVDSAKDEGIQATPTSFPTTSVNTMDQGLNAATGGATTNENLTPATSNTTTWSHRFRVPSPRPTFTIPSHPLRFSSPTSFSTPQPSLSYAQTQPSLPQPQIQTFSQPPILSTQTFTNPYPYSVPTSLTYPPPVYPSWSNYQPFPPQITPVYQKPSLTHFSGFLKSPSDVSFRQWKLEVESLRAEGYTDLRIITVMRQTLRGKAAEALLNMGSTVTVDQILAKFERLFGEIQRPEALLEDFFSARQREGESIAEWSCRLESYLHDVNGLQDSQQMMKSKFCTGLLDDRMRDYVKHKYEAGQPYEDLLVAARTLEEESQKRKKKVSSSSEGSKASSRAVSGNDGLNKDIRQLTQLMEKMSARLETLEKRTVPTPASGQGQDRKRGNWNRNSKSQTPSGDGNDKDRKESQVENSKSNRFANYVCRKCQQKGHIQRYCPN